jgi:hypothetical protein
MRSITLSTTVLAIAIIQQVVTEMPENSDNFLPSRNSQAQGREKVHCIAIHTRV